HTKYARLRGFVNRKCTALSANSWIAPMAPRPRVITVISRPNVDVAASLPKSRISPVPVHTRAVTGITAAAIIKNAMKKERVSRQHFQKYMTAPFERAAGRFRAGLAE